MDDDDSDHINIVNKLFSDKSHNNKKDKKEKRKYTKKSNNSKDQSITSRNKE